MSVDCKWCIFSGRDFCLGVIVVQRSPADCDVSERDREASIMRRLLPTRALRHGGYIHDENYDCVIPN